MQRKRLNSKNRIHTPGSETTVYVDYSASQEILEVEFAGGRTYHYFAVPDNVWEEYKALIKTGESSGTYVNQQIKPKYRYEEII